MCSLNVLQVRRAAYQPVIFYHAAATPTGPAPSHYRRFTITLRHATASRTTLDEGSARRRDFHFTTQNTHKRQAWIPRARFKPTIPASEWPLTHALARPLASAQTVNSSLKCLRLTKSIKARHCVRKITQFSNQNRTLSLHYLTER
jgi:hypothetical protein